MPGKAGVTAGHGLGRMDGREEKSMSTDQLKALVMERLIYENDEATLTRVLHLLSGHDSQVVVLTPAQEASINEGLADYKAGRYATQDEMDKEDEGWL